MSLVTRHLSAKMEIARLERVNADLLRQHSDTFRLLREAFPETLADSSVDAAIRRILRQQQEAARAIREAEGILRRNTEGWWSIEIARWIGDNAAALQRAREETRP